MRIGWRGCKHVDSHDQELGVRVHVSIIRRAIVSWLRSLQLLDHRYLGLSPFAGLNALVPRVTKVHVTITSAVSDPRPAAAATADFARFLNGATLGACSTVGRCGDC